MERRFRSEREGRMQGHPLSVLDGSCARRASGSRGAGHTPNIHTEYSAAHEHEEAEKYSRTKSDPARSSELESYEPYNL